MPRSKHRRVNLSLDIMAETFRIDPSNINASRYRGVALEYWEDEMIGDESLLAILQEIKDTP